jgi:hypothetical protein
MSPEDVAPSRRWILTLLATVAVFAAGVIAWVRLG